MEKTTDKTAEKRDGRHFVGLVETTDGAMYITPVFSASDLRKLDKALTVTKGLGGKLLGRFKQIGPLFTAKDTTIPAVVKTVFTPVKED